MFKNLTLKVIIIFAFILLVAHNAQSQLLTDMTCNIYNGTFNQITGGTVLVYTGDDNVYNVSLPFQFKFDNYYNSYVYVSCNGYVTLYPNYNIYSYYGYYLTDVYASIQAMRRDLYVRGELRYEVQGTAPNRVIIFQWLNTDFYYSYNANMNFQIRLYETSNKIEIVYGNMNPGSYDLWNYGDYYKPKVGFVGTTTGRYINIEPGSNFVAHFSTTNPAPNYNRPYVDGSNFQYFTSGKTISLTAFPSLVGTWPSEGTILQRGQIYDGSIPGQKPAMIFNRISGQAEVYGRYKISGPLPADPRINPYYKVIYTGTKLDPNDELVYFSPQPLGQPDTSYIPYAKGIAAGNNGALDLRTNMSQIKGGEYMVEAQMELPTFNYVQSIDPNKFVIANPYDLAIISLLSPRSKVDRKYPLTVTIPIQTRIANIGLTAVDSFVATCTITRNGNIEMIDTVRWPSIPNTPALTTGQSVQISFRNFRPRDIGDYSILITATPTYPPYDDDNFNNRYPRQGETFEFTVAYDIEAEAAAVITPPDTTYVGRPLLVRAMYKNNGVSVISDAPASVYIVKMSPPFDTVFRSSATIQDIPAGRNNFTSMYFPDNFIPPEPGTYKICISVNLLEDPITSNNIYCKTFEVVHAMAGTYTIGTTNINSPRNYPTIQSAVNDLYLRGVSGPVTFELTDAYYEVGDINAQNPALDLSSKIVGVSSTNTITFKPSILRSLAKGSVQIKLNSGVGIGVLFGQNASPNNQYAPVLEVNPSLVRKYANSDGYFIFDGGSQKSIKFQLNTNSGFRAVMYFANGASNISIKNCIIENYDNGNPSRNASLPLTLYNTGLSMFQFQGDVRPGNETYSVGILLRTVAPSDKGDPTSNTYNLDTLVNSNNVISGNEIKYFGYGVVSLGIGPLFNSGEARYKRYYNNNNQISNNIISDVYRAGIFLGHEENTIIQNNRIYNVNAITGYDGAGVIIGGDRRAGYFGYNNISIKVDGNEISGINSSVASYGIKVEQARNSYPFNNPPQVYFPDVNESMKIVNNIVWGLNASSQSAIRAGIYLTTERGAYSYLPRVVGYYTRNDQIINNTILITNIGSITTGNVAGVGIQSAKNTVFKNNAIALLDMNVDPNNDVYACLFYEGLMPSESGFVSDYNAFWYPNGSGAAVVRFVETDNDDNILDNGGDRLDYARLDQWQNWTSQDLNSVFGNFTNDFVYLGYEPNQRLRVATNPAPLGSLLNNRGERISWLTSDVDGNVRGAAGQRYDIGADEFDGRLYLSDVEVVKIIEPNAYQSSTGMFADAEYIMTNSPTNVRGFVRNNGNLQQSAINVTVNIYRELPSGGFSTTPELTLTKQVTIASGESAIVDYELADGINPDFKPKTFAELANQGYYIPDQFLTMEANVTPRYKIVISVGSDQNNTNNQVEKIVRFYIPQSQMRSCLSVENSMLRLDDNSTTDEIAGKLNYDSLLIAFQKLGWMIDVTEGIFDYDIVDRRGWEPKAVNYTLFNSVLWSDGDDKPLTRLEKIDIKRFFAAGTQQVKKNLVISSQEFVRSNSDDNEFLSLIRAQNVEPGNPMGSNVSNDGNSIVGFTIGRNITHNIKQTNYNGDVPPYCGLVGVIPNGEGLALASGYYTDHSGALEDSIAGVSTSTLTRNVVLFAVDWRHWANLEMVLRTISDYIQNNGGFIIPVELLSFDARAVGNAVNVVWTTASEYNTERFEVERARLTEVGIGQFKKVAEEKAAGQSTEMRSYGPVIDRDVELGGSYVYRLKVIDVDGSVSYSKEVMVKLDGSMNWIGEVKPNPASNELSFEIAATEGSQLRVVLVDMNGREVMTIFEGKGAGKVEVKTANVSSVPSGTYNLVAKIGNERIVRPVTIVR